MKIRLHPHAKDRAAERGATEAEVIATVREGGTILCKIRPKRFSPEFPF